jgi:hypothetical protein
VPAIVETVALPFVNVSGVQLGTSRPPDFTLYLGLPIVAEPATATSQRIVSPGT